MSSCTDAYPKMALLPPDRGTTFKEDRLNGSWEICDRIVGKEKEKNGLIKEQTSNMWLIFLNTVQFITTKLCTKFQDPKSSSS